MTNQDYIVFDRSGKILRLVNCPPNMLFMQIKSSERAISGVASIDDDYVVDGVIVQRPDNTAHVQGMSILRLPKPCTIMIDQDVYDVTSENITLDLPIPGDYQIVITNCFPYKDAILKVTV